MHDWYRISLSVASPPYRVFQKFRFELRNAMHKRGGKRNSIRWNVEIKGEVFSALLNISIYAETRRNSSIKFVGTRRQD